MQRSRLLLSIDTKTRVVRRYRDRKCVNIAQITEQHDAIIGELNQFRLWGPHGYATPRTWPTPAA